MFSRPTDCLHCSMESTNCSSALAASEGNGGLELLPKPSRSKAYTGRDRQSPSRFLIHRPTPPPKPWTITRGVLGAGGYRVTIKDIEKICNGLVMHTGVNYTCSTLLINKNWDQGGTLSCMFANGLVGEAQSPYSILVWEGHKPGPQVVLNTCCNHTNQSNY